MAISELYTGFETIGATEWSLSTDTSGPDADTTDGIYQMFLDTSDMVAGDELRIKLYEKVTSGGTQRAVDTWTLSGPQSSLAWVSPSVMLMHGWDWTLYAVTGTVAVSWSIRQVA